MHQPTSIVAAACLVCTLPAAAGAGADTSAVLLPDLVRAVPDGPPGRREVDIATAVAMDGPCIAVPSLAPHIDVLIARKVLEQLAKRARRDASGDEDKRLERIHAVRAQALLDLAAAQDGEGCARAAIGPDTQYLLARLLSSGQAVVAATWTRQSLGPIVATVTSMPGAGGVVTFHVKAAMPAAPPFFIYQAWVR